MSGMSQKQKDDFQKHENRIKRLEDIAMALTDNIMGLSIKMDNIVEANLKTIKALEGKQVISRIAPVEEKTKCL